MNLGAKRILRNLSRTSEKYTFKGIKFAGMDMLTATELNDEKNTFNLDDVENAKIIMDLDNYINDFSNAGKVNIQSFIQKNGQNYEYVLYYLSLNYGQSDKKDTVDLMKKVVSIDAATGKVVGTDKLSVRTGVEI